jgi:phage tail-like protein
MGFWGRGHDHIGNFNFRVELEGLTVGQFTNVEGLGSETEIIEYGGSMDQIVRKRPGRHKYLDIVLKRGWTDNSQLWDWRMAVTRGMVERKAGSIVICADDGSEITRFNFYDAWPAKAGGFKQDGKGNGTNIEEYTLAVERLERG